MGFSFKCPICGNTDLKYVGFCNGKPYCRKCITFKGVEPNYSARKLISAPLNISYELSDEQKRLSNRLVSNYKSGIDSLVHAVCGSGKTEIVLDVIRCAIESGERVGFAIPRRDVVVEIYSRLKELFSTNKVVSIYGGHIDKLEGDLIVLTTHQLFRYKNYFNLLIVDEIDAFPFSGNDVLQNIMHRSLKGRLIFMSATPSKQIIKKFSTEGHEVLTLYERFHKYPLPVPEYKKTLLLKLRVIKETRRLLKTGNQLFIFTPTIEICEKLFKILTLIFKQGNYVHSKRKMRSQIIDKFKQGKLKFLVTTAVLERGVTVAGLNVIVYEANHKIYNSQTLVQISGRVGRKASCPTGEVIYICKECTNEIKDSIEQIQLSNSNLQNVF